MDFWTLNSRLDVWTLDSRTFKDFVQIPKQLFVTTVFPSCCKKSRKRNKKYQVLQKQKAIVGTFKKRMNPQIFRFKLLIVSDVCQPTT